MVINNGIKDAREKKMMTQNDLAMYAWVLMLMSSKIGKRIIR